MDFCNIIYSVSGKKAPKTYKFFSEVDPLFLTEKEKRVLSYCVKFYEKNFVFPTYTFLTDKFGEYERLCKSPADVKQAVLELLGEREHDDLILKAQQAISTSESTIDLKEKLAIGLKDHKSVISIITPQKSAKEFCEEVFYGSGFTFGLKELDELTGGFQPGLLTSVAGFTSHYKSASWQNACYINMVAGKKIGFLSLEIPKDFCYIQILARHSFAMGNSFIPHEKIIKNKLTEQEKLFLLEEVEPDYLEQKGKIIYLEEVDFPSFTYQGIVSVLNQLDELMGGLDFLVVDHINLFQYIGDKNLTGDYYVKQFADIAKSYRNVKGSHIGVGLAVQCNREGYKRAVKAEGRYDLLALSEFREIERSSTYVTFLYSTSHMMASGEILIQMLKNRIGQVMEQPILTSIFPSCSVLGDNFTDISNVGYDVNGIFSDEAEDDITDFS